MTRHADDTTRGIVVPLATTAIVCLLLTSGVVFFSGSDPDPGDRADRGDHVALDLPTATAAEPTGATPTAGPARPSRTGSGTPTARATSEAPTSTPTKPARPAATTTRPTAPTGTASIPDPPRQDRPSSPPAATTPATTVPVPPADANPRDITVESSYTSSPWGAAGRVVITNTTPLTLPSWDLTLTASGRNSGFTTLHGSGASTSTDRRTAVARGNGPLAPGASVVLDFGLYGTVRSMDCAFTGVTCRVRDDRDDD